MGYQLAREAFSEIFESIKKKYDIWAPVRKEGEGTFSEIDVIRYDKIEELNGKSVQIILLRNRCLKSERRFFILQKMRQSYRKSRKKICSFFFVPVKCTH